MTPENGPQNMPAAGRDPKYAAPESKEITETLSEIDALRNKVEAAKDAHPERWPAVLEKLKIEWTADSNAIEGSSLSFGDTKRFIETGLTVDGKPFKDFVDARNHYEAVNMLFEIAGEGRPITEGALKEHNALLLHGVETVPSVDRFGKKVDKPINPGAYKREPNTVLLRDGGIHQYVDPLLVPEQMEQLVKWIAEESDKLHPAVASAIAHYNFVRIHPFDDGNGRGARILMNLMLLRRGFAPGVVRNEDRNLYLDTLAQADKGDLQPFVAFILNSLKRTLEVMAKDLNGS